MSRPGCAIKGGFYPCPIPVVEQLGGMITATPDCTVIDPCCGEAEALATLATALHLPPSQVWGVELEEGRTATAKARLPDSHILGPADFMATKITSRSFSVAWVNPPFDDELGGGARVELSFLHRATQLLDVGGIVVFICPQSVVEDSYKECPKHLMRWFGHLRMIKFPEEHERYNEVAVIGRRLGKANEISDSYGTWNAVKNRSLVESWTAPPTPGPVTFEKSSYTPAEFTNAIIASPLWDLTSGRKARVQRRPPLPPAKGHLALLLAGGMLNGVVHKPGETPHVVRGTAQKIQLPPVIEEITDDQGALQKTVTTVKETIKLVVRAVDETGEIRTFE